MSHRGDRLQGNRQHTQTHLHTFVHTFTDRWKCRNNPEVPFCSLVASSFTTLASSPFIAISRSTHLSEDYRVLAEVCLGGRSVLTTYCGFTNSDANTQKRCASSSFFMKTLLCVAFQQQLTTLLFPECHLCHKTPEAKRPAQPPTHTARNQTHRPRPPRSCHSGFFLFA